VNLREYYCEPEHRGIGWSAAALIKTQKKRRNGLLKATIRGRKPVSHIVACRAGESRRQSDRVVLAPALVSLRWYGNILANPFSYHTKRSLIGFLCSQLARTGSSISERRAFARAGIDASARMCEVTKQEDL